MSAGERGHIGNPLGAGYTPAHRFFKDCTPMKRLLLPLIALAVLASALGGCGQKGPLYHPDDEATANERSKDRFEL